jgi:hypothetical protein
MYLKNSHSWVFEVIICFKEYSFFYIITFLDSLLEGLQEFPILKQIISLEIGLKCLISNYNQGHKIHELRTRESMWGGGGGRGAGGVEEGRRKVRRRAGWPLQLLRVVVEILLI